MKKLLFLLLAAVLLASCSSDGDEGKDLILKSGDKTQIVYADETSAAGADGIKFTAAQPWKAMVSEVAARAAGTGRVEWLELSAYEGGAGEFTLTITLQPNLTGADRKAIISIVCGDTTITITVEQKATKQDGTTPDTTNPLGKMITKIECTNYYQKEFEGVNLIEISYDNQGRVAKMVETHEDDCDGMPTPTIKTVSTCAISYGNNSVAYKITQTENGASTEHIDSGSITLDANGRAVSGSLIDYYEKDNSYSQANYTLTYDSDGYLKDSRSADEQSILSEEKLTWTNGNPTEVWWGETNGKQLIDKATYGNVPNNANLDLNWLFALDSEGFDFAAADPKKIFSALGYVGKRSKNMAELLFDAHENQEDPSQADHKYEYEVDKDGYVTTITSYYYSYWSTTKGWEKTRVISITYNK